MKANKAWTAIRQNHDGKVLKIPKTFCQDQDQDSETQYQDQDFIFRPRGASRPRLHWLTASDCNQSGQYANSHGHRAYCYAELAVSSLAESVAISSSRYHQFGFAK